MKFYTIGYGGRHPDDFVRLLQDHGVRTLVDVRATPQRASMGAYVLAKSPDKGIQRLLSGAGVDYVWLEELGNPFRTEPDWLDRYSALLSRDAPRMLARLADVPEPFCLLCAEKRVADCHRKLIADAMVARGDIAVHIE